MKRKLRQKSTKPSWRRTLLEGRWISEFISYFAHAEEELVASAPKGDRRPILVIPGFLCSDVSTWPLRRYLKKIGYRSYAWHQGVNWGPRMGVRTRLLKRIHEIRARTGYPVTLIGWSLGGVYAREVACTRPDLIQEVVTLGSPQQGQPELTAVWRLFRWLNRKSIAPWQMREIDFPQPEHTPCLSIYTKEDGIVPWQLCVPQRGRPGHCREVKGSHIGLVSNPEVMRFLGSHLGAQKLA